MQGNCKVIHVTEHTVPTELSENTGIHVLHDEYKYMLYMCTYYIVHVHEIHARITLPFPLGASFITLPFPKVLSYNSYILV